MLKMAVLAPMPIARTATTAIRKERSEERRVGKEGRSRWSPYHLKKKKKKKKKRWGRYDVKNRVSVVGCLFNKGDLRRHAYESAWKRIGHEMGDCVIRFK